MEGLPTGFTESGTLCSIQEKLPTVVEACKSLGTPEGVDEVLTYLAPEMGKETSVYQLKVAQMSD